MSENEARELYNMSVSSLCFPVWAIPLISVYVFRLLRFFSGCHYFIPLFDPSYDTFDSLKSRTPFCFDSILAVASKIRGGSGPPSETFHRCLEEAQGIARSTLFGPVVRKEAVQGTLSVSFYILVSITVITATRSDAFVRPLHSHVVIGRLEHVGLVTRRTRDEDGARSRFTPCLGEAR